jgi:hypothetical protein
MRPHQNAYGFRWIIQWFPNESVYVLRVILGIVNMVMTVEPVIGEGIIIRKRDMVSAMFVVRCGSGFSCVLQASSLAFVSCYLPNGLVLVSATIETFHQPMCKLSLRSR